ncbi:MAG: alpha/beta fold hydrolase [Dehalococcoidales bacterium]
MITRDVTLNVDDLNIVGRLFLPAEAPREPYPGICICHGIPSGKPHEPTDGGYPALAERFCRLGYAVFIFNFRGTGNSGGNLDLPGWKRDLQAAVDYFSDQPELDRTKLTLLGFSAGAAVAICVASADTRVSSVIACACPAQIKFDDPLPVIEHFRSIGAIRDKGFPASVEDWGTALSGASSPLNFVNRIAPRPLLLVHGSQDETVPLSQAYELYEQAGEPRQLVVIDGAGHRLRRNDLAINIVLDWLKFQS